MAHTPYPPLQKRKEIVGIMSSISEEDQRRLLESRHDLNALDDIHQVILEPLTQQLLDFSKSSLSARREELLACVQGAARERSETDTERARLQNSVADCVRRYMYVRSKVQDALLNISPDIQVESAEIDRRRKLIERYFRQNGSELERGSVSWALETIGTVVQALNTEPDFTPLALGSTLGISHAAALQAAKDLNREVDEDSMAISNLRTARENFDRAGKAHALLLESALVREGKADKLGRYVLAKDAAYSARRAAREPLDKEPGAGNVSGEAGTAKTP